MKKNLSFFFFFSLSILSFSQNIDINLLKHINLDRNKKFDNPCKFLSNSLAPIVISIPAIFISSGFIQKNNQQKQNGYIIGSSFLLSTFISTTLKYSIKRKRPFETYSFIERGANVTTPSFPSGHTTAAFSTATSITLLYPKWYVGIPAYTWACSVAYSRMHLGVHYPFDILIGAIIGTSSAILCYKAQKYLSR